MAVLDNNARAATCADLYRDFRGKAIETAGTKQNWRNLVDSLDVFLNTNVATINAAIPLPERAIFTPREKALALVGVISKRFEGGN